VGHVRKENHSASRIKSAKTAGKKTQAPVQADLSHKGLEIKKRSCHQGQEGSWLREEAASDVGRYEGTKGWGETESNQEDRADGDYPSNRKGTDLEEESDGEANTDWVWGRGSITC